MEEPELRKQLLNQVADNTDRLGDQTRQEARRLVRRARRRTHILAGVTILLWLLVAIGVFYMVYGYFVFFHPIFVMALTEKETPAQLPQAVRLLPDFTIYATLIWGALIVLAAVATVLFVLVSRQATLHQIQLSLEEVVERLKS